MEEARTRRETRRIQLGQVPIGQGAPISVQSMTTTDTRDVKGTVAQIRRLSRAGCEIVRVAVRDEEAARALKPIHERIALPLIGDIHFDHRLACWLLRLVSKGSGSIPAI